MDLVKIFEALQPRIRLSFVNDDLNSAWGDAEITNITPVSERKANVLADSSAKPSQRKFWLGVEDADQIIHLRLDGRTIWMLLSSLKGFTSLKGKIMISDSSIELSREYLYRFYGGSLEARKVSESASPSAAGAAASARTF